MCVRAPVARNMTPPHHVIRALLIEVAVPEKALLSKYHVHTAHLLTAFWHKAGMVSKPADREQTGIKGRLTLWKQQFPCPRVNPIGAYEQGAVSKRAVLKLCDHSRIAGREGLKPFLICDWYAEAIRFIGQRTMEYRP